MESGRPAECDGVTPTNRVSIVAGDATSGCGAMKMRTFRSQWCVSVFLAATWPCIVIASRGWPSRGAGSEPLQVRSATLEVARTFGADTQFGALADIAVTGKQIIVIDGAPLESGHQIVVIDRGTGDAVHATGRRGQGPGEFQNPQFVVRGRPEREEFWVRDSALRRLVGYELGEWTGIPFEEMTDRAPRLLMPAWLGDDLVSNGLYPGELLSFFDVKQGYPITVRGFGQWPVPDETTPGAGQAAQNVLATDPNGARVAVAFVLKSLLQIYNRDGNLLADSLGPVTVDFVPRLSSVAGRFRPTGDTRFAYVDLATSREHVFALFSGRYFRESQEAGAAVHQLSTQIHVFTWEGVLVAVWDLPNPVSRIAADPTSGVLYAIQEAPETVVVEYSPIRPNGFSQ